MSLELNNEDTSISSMQERLMIIALKFSSSKHIEFFEFIKQHDPELFALYSAAYVN